MVVATGGKRKPYEPPLRSLLVRKAPVVRILAVARGTEIHHSQLALLRTAQALAFPLQEATTHPGATMIRARWHLFYQIPLPRLLRVSIWLAQYFDPLKLCRWLPYRNSQPSKLWPSRYKRYQLL
jgi:hypothetical protein